MKEIFKKNSKFMNRILLLAANKSFSLSARVKFNYNYRY